MTEDEAKTKWCPFARVIFHADEDADWQESSCNKLESIDKRPPGDVMVPNGAKCIASDCMMWRTRKDKNRYDSDGMHPEIGYCGLAK